MDLYPFFDWLDTSLLADISKAYGGVFAVVQMFHLLGISMLGGMVLVGDLRLLNIVMKDIPSEVVIENTHKWFNVALVIIVISGIFMSSAVALKLYYNSMFWAKMASLGAGVLFSDEDDDQLSSSSTLVECTRVWLVCGVRLKLGGALA